MQGRFCVQQTHWKSDGVDWSRLGDQPPSGLLAHGWHRTSSTGEVHIDEGSIHWAEVSLRVVLLHKIDRQLFQLFWEVRNMFYM